MAQVAHAPASAEVQAALAVWLQAGAQAVHRAQVALARLVVDLGPPGAAAQLALAERFLAGDRVERELLDAKQDCWTYVGSLACGCSIADSSSAHALLICLERAPEAHTASALAEHVDRVLRCGVSTERVLGILQAPPGRADR